MNTPWTSFLILLLAASLPAALLATDPWKDFLITLDGSKLTGTIKDISFANGHSTVSFINDFGSTYEIDPSTIFGFVCQNQGQPLLFESKFLYGRWQFLKVENRGAALSLYTSMERQLQFTRSEESPLVVVEKNPQLWLQFAGEEPIKVYRLTYKGVLRKRMVDCPDLLKRLGKRGFRYKDLPHIVELYNRLHEQKKT